MPKTVKPAGQGASAPNRPVPKKAAKRKTTKKSAATSARTNTSFYIRNLHNGAGGLRITLSDDRELRFQPRGARGDIVLVDEEIKSDPLYQRNLGLTFEELTLDEGREVQSKQHINAQASGPSTWDHLTNEEGKKYTTTGPTMRKSHEEQAFQVGAVSEATEGQSSQNVGHITRRTGLGPEEVAVPGSRPVFDPNVMPAGLSMAQAKEYMETPAEQRADLLARWGVESLRSSVQMNPVQKVQ